MKVQSINKIAYHQVLNLLVMEGYFFRVNDLDYTCIELMKDFLQEIDRLTVCIKADMIDTVTYKSLEKLFIYLSGINGLKNGINIKWMSEPESLPMGERLKNLVESARLLQVN